MLLDGLTGLKISVQKQNTITANHQPVVRKTESIAAGSGQIGKLACFCFSPSAVRNTRWSWIGTIWIPAEYMWTNYRLNSSNLTSKHNTEGQSEFSKCPKIQGKQVCITFAITVLQGSCSLFQTVVPWPGCQFFLKD